MLKKIEEYQDFLTREGASRVKLEKLLMRLNFVKSLILNGDLKSIQQIENLSEMMGDFELLKSAYELELSVLIKERKVINEFINNQEEPYLVSLLTYRILEGMTWEEIEGFLPGSDKTNRRLYKKFIKTLSEN